MRKETTVVVVFTFHFNESPPFFIIIIKCSLVFWFNSVVQLMVTSFESLSDMTLWDVLVCRLHPFSLIRLCEAAATWSVCHFNSHEHQVKKKKQH